MYMPQPTEHLYLQDVSHGMMIPLVETGIAQKFSTLASVFIPDETPLVDYSEFAPTVHIGTIEGTADLKTIAFRCSAPACNGGTFSRWHELKRHFNGSHTIQGVGEEFWREIPQCERNKCGGRPFPRKDKLIDHVRKVHVFLEGGVSSK